MNKQIQILSIAATAETSPWRFIPTGDLYINDHDIDAKTGRLEYENPLFLFDVCVKIKDWVFTVEKNVANPFATRSFWMIGAFNGKAHFSFLKMLGDDMSSHQKTFVAYLWDKIVPILCPEVFESNQDEDSLEYEIIPFEKKNKKE